MRPVRFVARAIAVGAQTFRKQLQDNVIEAGAITLKPGRHTIVETDTERVGIFRDRDGALHAVDARCTHVDWELDFDSRTRTWACPRHGARFSIDGAVLDGPTTVALRTVEMTPELCAKLLPGHGMTS